MKKKVIFILSMILLANAGALRAENIGVPAECEDVMLQVFYWDSYDSGKSSTKYGRTKWVDLLKDTAAINANFDIVWFPPSAKGGGVGYTHKQLSNQNGDWGTKEKLVELMSALHAGNTKILADIVINHRGNKSNWCDFEEDKFGEGYGSFQLTQKHICKGDECFTKSESTCYGVDASERGAADTGDNFDGARDLDHTNEYVQEWAKAYVRWMLEVMKYDGFRYDMTLGYHGKYLSMYNEAAKPYMSVSELWHGIDRQKQHLEEANYNTMVFDFQQKYELHKAIVNGSYSKLMKNSNSFRGQGLERYAVTFIDNHDTFERDGYGSNQFGGQYIDLSNAAKKAQIMQAHAYILLMPGVPCVFWPHWYSYKQEINQLIAIRKLAGIHSESEVTDEAYVQYGYTGTIHGKHHNVILRLGKNRDMTVPAGYYQHINADHYTVYVEGVQGVENIQPSAANCQKVLQDGQLLIHSNGKTYNAQGILLNN